MWKSGCGTVSESSSPDRGESEGESIPALAIVFADQGKRIAVTARDRPTLPEVVVPNRFYPEIEEFLETATSTLGLDLSVLKCLDDGDWENGTPRLYSLAAGCSADELKDDFRWMDSAEVDRIGSLTDAQFSSIRLERDRVTEQRPHGPTAEWELSGSWECDTRQWIGSHLGSRVTRLGWTITPVRSWSISSVVRISAGPASSSERFYFKASPTFFTNEATVTAAVADRFPQISPRLVAVDRTRGWMLMEDLGNLTLGAADSADLWRETMRALARVQIEYANDPGSLESLGLERRSTSAISGTLRQWVQNPRDLGLHYASQRTQSALGRLEPHLDLVEQLCCKVESTGLPQTLDHGDLDAGNMFVREGSPVIMDWSDASISNPLFAPALIPQVARDSSLADAFLAEWSEFFAMDRLQEAYEAAGPIAALERAFHYHRNIVAHLAYPSVDLRVLEAYIPDLLNLAASDFERFA